ncbi:hypothetical protein CC_1027 [Caulobacter vibrioides CB15]|uniref:Uncharacterized protein n=2 Tax=Caulobacter vibrioides TaxID=155892 RepID=Q9A9G1_CAUVC|nr:hypothetical protein CC_1027 [Caulobacter vibrioides CB15]
MTKRHVSRLTCKRGLLKAPLQAYIAGMTDKTDTAPEGETPMQRALRLKKAAQGRHGHGPKASSGKVERSSAAAPTGKSKPWMTR